ncbi:MAG TPA: zinc ABC transporter permease subunit ZnuB [Gammaproteobacteria bacterium]|nr:zinc ABC transporter permease subunit ZnuB [Gammaproteobacteria bacterium]
MEEFLLRALLGGLGLALIAGPLGVFIVWRRMAYFGDTLAHSALLGVGLGFWLSIDPMLTVMMVCALIAVLLVVLQSNRELASDTLLGILAHSTLSLGIIVVAFLQGLRVDLFSYLFGDILAVSSQEIVYIYLIAAVVLSFIIKLWRPLLLSTLNADLAIVAGLSPQKLQFILMLLLAMVIAIAMKIIGVLLITSLLIIPAACARRFARSPEQMALFASVIGMFAVMGGLAASFHFDLPTGPAIVVCAASMFLLSRMVRVR